MKIAVENIKRQRTFPSKSKAGEEYTTTLQKDGTVSCNCLGWIYHRKCWHCNQV